MFMKDEKWLIVVTAGRWQYDGIIEAKKLGLKILSIDTDPYAKGFEISDYKLISNLQNYKLLIEKIKKLNFNIVGVISFCSEVGLLLCAKIRKAFSLPGINEETTLNIIDKGNQRKYWKNFVPGPEYFNIYGCKKIALKDSKNIKFPYIIKPTDSSGSRGITKISSINDNICEAIESAFKHSISKKIIIESFMTGKEFTVEVFLDNSQIYILAITKKNKVKGTKGTVASELITPEINRKLFTKIEQVVRDSYLKLNYRNGPGHAEIIISKSGKIGVVEIAGRGGGFMVFDKLVPYASGINVSKLSILQAIGNKIKKFNVRRNYVALCFFPNYSKGTVVKIKGFEKFNKLKNVEGSSFVNLGDKISVARTDADRMGYFICKENNYESLLKKVKYCKKLIQFEVI